jgi:alkylation response protein AidB-like acyl-CoA dehydrogenase
VDVSDFETTAAGYARLRERLVSVVETPLPTPGTGMTIVRFQALWEIARGDLELARLAEAHYDAHAIAADMGAEIEHGMYGVWAATGLDPLTATATTDGYSLSGVLPWCTGVGVLDRALVAARSSDDQQSGFLLDVPIHEVNIEEAERPWFSPAFLQTGTAALRFRHTVPLRAAMADRSRYFERAGFWHGAVGVAACWGGGLRGLLDRYTESWRRTDNHSLAHLGSVHAWSNAIEAVLEKAASDIDALPDDIDVAEARARSVRHVVERACTMALDALAVGAGPEPLAFDPFVVTRTQQLQLYIRQCHGGRDLEPLGRHVLTGPEDGSKGV